jgi:hypothetical protein
MDTIMKYEYYYNNVPGKGLVRNNLVYTSLISTDKKTFVKWYHNDSNYHQGQNKVVDPSLMESKWLRELNFLTQMRNTYPDLVPVIKNIDFKQRKIYLEIDGVDFWQQHYDNNCTYNTVLSDWQEQILLIMQAHKSLGIYKYSMHPSSYFIVGGRLKSINYFFAYNANEPPITVNQVISHISEERVEDAKRIADIHGITFDTPIDLNTFQLLIFESFKNNYPSDFMDKLKLIYS